MKRIACLFVMLVIAVPPGRAERKLSISQWGITWTFDKAYECGQYCTGDWWVKGPVIITDIDPASTMEAGRTKNGSMLNPDPAVTGQGYDSHAHLAESSYKEFLNAGLNIYAGSGNTLTVPVNSSLISCESIEAPDEWPQLKSAAVLTVVGETPPANSFRPPFCGTDKTPEFSKDDLDLSLLKELTIPPAAQVTTLPEIITRFERPWIDHLHGWTNGRFAPADNMPSYGRDFGYEIGVGATALHCDWGVENDSLKQHLYACYVQIGIDLYGALRNGLYWPSEMGIFGGRKWPILFAGLALNEKGDNATSAGMRNIGAKSGAYLYAGNYGPNNMPPDYIRFQEDEQTFYVTQADVDQPHDPDSWSEPDLPGIAACNYSAADVGLPDWGGRHAWHPWQDARDWYENSYRRCCTANSRAGYILGALLTGARKLWNHEALFDYQDRYMEITLADTGTYGGFGGYHRAMKKAFIEVMWDTYRPQYGGVWKRSDPSELYSPGIIDYSRCLYDCPQAIADRRELPVSEKIIFLSSVNPFGHIIRINRTAAMELLDTRGNAVRSARNTDHLETGSTAPGIYLLRITTETENVVLPAVKCD